MDEKMKACKDCRWAKPDGNILWIFSKLKWKYAKCMNPEVPGNSPTQKTKQIDGYGMTVGKAPKTVSAKQNAMYCAAARESPYGCSAAALYFQPNSKGSTDGQEA